jgi:hypothetical protein
MQLHYQQKEKVLVLISEVDLEEWYVNERHVLYAAASKTICSWDWKLALRYLEYYSDPDWNRLYLFLRVIRGCFCIYFISDTS